MLFTKLEQKQAELKATQMLLAAKVTEQNDKSKEIDNFDLSAHGDFYDRFDDMLDECNSDFNDQCVANFGSCYSRALKELSPTTYRCGYVDYLDSLDNSECSEFTDLESEFEELESDVADLENKEADLESEIEDIEVLIEEEDDNFYK